MSIRPLFDPPWKFEGFDARIFEVFAIPDREGRRREIITTIHPALDALADDLIGRLPLDEAVRLHKHLPRLDWPPGYRPFCTWLALSTLSHGYQSAAQLNVGVHHDFVAARLGWDVAADAFGRFEFRCRHGQLGGAFEQVARQSGLEFRVYAAAPWPQGSRQVYASSEDWRGAFDEAARRGVWWELGRRWEITDGASLMHGAAAGPAILATLAPLIPLYLESND